MAKKLIKHGSRSGYDAELAAGGPGNVCERCRAAKRVYQSQFSKTAKAAGIKYKASDVIDHLDGQRQASPRQRQRSTTDTPPSPDRQATVRDTPTDDTSGQEPTAPAQSPAGPTLADRLGEGLRRVVGNRQNDEYIANDEPPEYIHAGEPDPEPSEGDWQGPEEDYVINAAGMRLIEDNLGTYASVIGITLEMVDPYCGPILADNFDNIVNRWSKVIARYPRAAKLFMSKDGGTLFVWIGAIQATWPVLLAIYEHHLAKTIQTDKEGRVFKVNKPSANGHGEPVDATMPPQYNYTVD